MQNLLTSLKPRSGIDGIGLGIALANILGPLPIAAVFIRQERLGFAIMYALMFLGGNAIVVQRAIYIRRKSKLQEMKCQTNLSSSKN